MRGAGRAIVPMLVMLVCWCVIRVSYIMLVARASGNIQDGVLGLSHHLGAQLRGLFALFRARRLAALSRKERKGGLKGRPLRLTCPAA